jgi:predicted membrane-bound dolichyl-phosphate-mannose-protein mannosyltransferase
MALNASHVLYARTALEVVLLAVLVVLFGFSLRNVKRHGDQARRWVMWYHVSFGSFIT